MTNIIDFNKFKESFNRIFEIDPDRTAEKIIEREIEHRKAINDKLAEGDVPEGAA